MNRMMLCTLNLIIWLSSSNSSFAATMQQTSAQTPSKTMQVTVDEKGFQPASLSVRANVSAQITFLRTSDKTCATAVVIADYNIKRDLPLNKPVLVELTPKKSGEITFVCGMNMFKGKLVVTEK